MKFPTAYPQDCNNRAQVDELANATRDARGSDPQYDDIFLLRFVLSVMAPSRSPYSQPLGARPPSMLEHAGELCASHSSAKRTPGILSLSLPRASLIVPLGGANLG
jgi:hypothetical protein